MKKENKKKIEKTKLNEEKLDDILDEFVNEYQGDTKASFDFIEYVKNRHSHCCNINGKSTYYRIVVRKK